MTMINAHMDVILRNIRLVIADCDGVLTDGGLYYSEDGTEMRKFHVLDGTGFILLKRAGVATGIVTGDVTNIVDHRANKLQVDYFYKGRLDKLEVIRSIAEKEQISLDEVAYIADDIFDVEAICVVGFGCVPISADQHIRSHAKYITQKRGGEGCFREVADLILQAKKV